MLPLAASNVIDLPAARREGPRVLASGPKQKCLCDVAKIKANASPITAAIPSQFMPNYDRLIIEPPRRHYLQSVRYQSIWNPKIEVRCCIRLFRYRKFTDLHDIHRRITGQTLMLGCDLPSAIKETPRGIC
jgi:hypothetical protein